MKKFSFLSAIIFLVGVCCCVSCGYLVSNALVLTFQTINSVSIESQTVYAISTFSSDEKNNVEEQKENLQKQNGAGFVFQFDSKYHLVASVYENQNDAEKVKKNLQTAGLSAEILKIETPKKEVEGNFSNEEKTVLTNCLKSNFEIFKKLYDISISFDTKIFDETKAKLECNNVFSSHVSTKSNFDTLFKNHPSPALKEASQNLKNVQEILSNLIAENFDSSGQTFSSLIKQSYCNILLAQ